MIYTKEVRFKGKFFRIGAGYFLWFTKGPRRRDWVKTVPTVVQGIQDKSSGHPWQQGPIRWWITSLTKRGELVIDPTCGSGPWGKLCLKLGRRWIGCDIVEGGSTRIEV
jgi:hypothetical protein